MQRLPFQHVGFHNGLCKKMTLADGDSWEKAFGNILSLDWRLNIQMTTR